MSKRKAVKVKPLLRDNKKSLETKLKKTTETAKDKDGKDIDLKKFNSEKQKKIKALRGRDKKKVTSLSKHIKTPHETKERLD